MKQIKLLINLTISSILIIAVVLTIIFANNPKLLESETSKLAGKPLYEVETYQNDKGLLKYAFGSCSKNEDCTPAGCSKQVCSSDPELVTTCEVAEDFPDVFVYSCGCVKDRCVWYKP